MIAKFFTLRAKELNQERIEMFDFFRGGAVLLVLLHHAGIPYGKYILSFHMPLFFILSGYLYKCLNTIGDKLFLDFIKLKIVKILIPYMGFELIILILSVIFSNHEISLLEAIKSIILCINTNEYQGITLRLWFLPCIFVSEIFFYLVVRYLGNKKIRYFMPLFFFILSKLFNVIVLYRMPFTLDTSLMGTGFILCGYYFSDVRRRMNTKFNAVMRIVFLFMFCLSTYLNDNLLMYIDEYGSYFLSIVSSLTGSYLFMVFFNDIYNIRKNGRMCSYILFLGRNSLIFFPIHLILLFFSEKVLGRIGFNIWIFKVLIVGIACIPVINFVRIYIPILSGQKS